MKIRVRYVDLNDSPRGVTNSSTFAPTKITCLSAMCLVEYFVLKKSEKDYGQSGLSDLNRRISKRSGTDVSDQEGQYLVAGGGKPNTLYEYSFDSFIPKRKCLERSIVMGDGILHPRRAVETINDLILVSQADERNRICLIDATGRLLQSYNESEEINFNYPHQLQVDQTGHILVSDYSKGRLILLNPELKYVKDFNPRSDDLGCISTFYLDENRKLCM